MSQAIDPPSQCHTDSEYESTGLMRDLLIAPSATTGAGRAFTPRPVSLPSEVFTGTDPVPSAGTEHLPGTGLVDEGPPAIWSGVK
jgi:hypothetical protein